MMISASRKRGIVMPRKEMKPKQRVDPAVLPGGGDDAEGDAEDRCQDVAGQREHDGARQPLGDDVAHRLVVVEAVAEIEAGDDAPDPVEILDRQRVVEAVRHAVGLGLQLGRLVRGAALVDEHGGDVVAVVARRRLDDAEGHELRMSRTGIADKTRKARNRSMAVSVLAEDAGGP